MLPGKKIALADVLQMARRRVWLIVVVPAVTLFAALLYSSTIADLYQSDMLIAVDPQRVPDAFVRSTVTTPTDQRMDAITVQVLSRTTLENMIQSLNLYPEQRQRLPMEDVIGLMRSNIDVRLDRSRPQLGAMQSVSAFHVRFTHPDPKIAAEVTERLGLLFVDQNSRDRAALAGATNRFLETQLVEARKKLEQQERKLELFRQRHGQELPTQLQSNMQGLANAQLQVQSLVESIARDRDRKQVLERLYREAMAEPAAPAALPATPGQSGPNAGGGTAQQRLATARATLADLELRYKPDHPDVMRTKRLIAELEPKAAAEEKQRASGETPAATAPIDAVADAARRENLRQMRAEIESLDRQVAFKESEEQRVRGEIAEYQRRLEAVPGLESEWVALTRDYDTQQAAYKELLGKSAAAQVAANLEEQEIGESFRIVDAASVPVHPLDSMRGRVNAIGLALGLALGIGLAGLLEFRDASFRSEADVLEILALPVLANVPKIVSEKERRQRRHRTALLSAAGVAGVAVAGYLTWTLQLWKSLT